GPSAAGSFFFSSTRRHTTSKRDWSSDVCPSDLHHALQDLREVIWVLRDDEQQTDDPEVRRRPQPAGADLPTLVEESRDVGVEVRSEERRVGNGRRSRRGAAPYEQTTGA